MRALPVISCALLVGSLGLWALYRQRRARLARFARRVTCGSDSPETATLLLARALFLRIKRRPNPVFFAPWLAPLGPSPTAVLDHGGCCSGIHRLFIASLDTLGIRSGQITVYRQPGPVAAHCLAQVHMPPAPMLIDVDYGVHYRHPQGGPINLTDLRAGLVPQLEPFVTDPHARRVEGKICGPPGYPANRYFEFDYRATCTANWTLSRVRRWAYRVLLWTTRGRVNEFLVPPLLEWPEVLLASVAAALGVALFATDLALQ